MGNAARSDNRDQLSQWLWDYLLQHTGEDRWFYVVLDRRHDVGSDASLTDAEKDRAEMFKEMIDGLIEIHGGEDAAAEWLLHESEFKRVGESDPIEYLEDGNFWTLALLSDVVKINLQDHRADKPAVVTSISCEETEAWVCASPRRPYGMYDIDLLTAAWGWSQEEMAKALGATPADLQTWRNHEVQISSSALNRSSILRTLQWAIWTTLPPGDYASWWRKTSKHFNGRTALNVALQSEDGFDRVLGAFRSASW